ncbi:tRNA (guanosine(37)-N1)-methyltransferase TrmD [Thermodesulfatator atlanticus]|uniref:tRNA (guanosine(37)-N1)-methyltransferase TrmD n=1 Tax=Thermodesulfatator atlanticus TaxID=501497 RepID=UPI0004279421
MRFDIITIFPEYFESPLKVGALKKAQEKGLISINFLNLRDFAFDKHKMVDDRPFGGGEGMVFKPEPLFRAIEKTKREGNPYIVYLSPQGRLLNQKIVRELYEKKHLVLICGRYEGIDERIREHFIHDEISIGDYVVFGGEVAALVIVEAVARLVPGVVGKRDSVEKETFSQGLLKYPQYTRPRNFMGYEVPQVLLSGDHAKIEKWRRQKSLEVTFKRRPDLLKAAELTPEDKEFLKKLGWKEDA